MIDPAVAPDPSTPLHQLLVEHFSEPALSASLGGTPGLDSALWEAALRGPLSQFLGHPGKGLRARLMDTAYSLAGGQGTCPAALSLVIEALHAGSLIIDDIEDGSASRRGRPALHVQFGVPVALNAGNWLYFWALTLVEKLELPDATTLSLLRCLNRTLLRCHHGQGLDVTARIDGLGQEQVMDVVATSTGLKTGALMELSTSMAATVAGADAQVVTALAAFGGRLGVALQMLDDLGGLLSDARSAKGTEDLLLGRPTWPWAWLSLELPAREFARLQRAARRVRAVPEGAPRLLAEMKAALQGSGRVLVRRHVSEALAALKSELGPSAAFEQLTVDVACLEKSYG